MNTVPQVAEAMQTILITTADTVARETGFVQRESKMGGAEFIQTLVFGWLANPEATLEELAQTAATVGVEITPQGLDQRFTPAAADCLKQVLDAAIDTLIAAAPVFIPILQRFKGVYLQDSTSLVLPDALADIWRGCGGGSAKNTAAALKLQVRLDLSTGMLHGPILQDGRSNDRSSSLQTTALPQGALRVADLGYFSLEVMRDLDQQGVFWLSRLHTGTAIFNPAGQACDLLDLLMAEAAVELDMPVRLGTAHHLPARLLAVPVPQEVADRRRQRLREDAQRRGKTVSQKRLALANWTFFVTNVPNFMLTLREALVLARARWQIELLFKLWKQLGRIDESRSAKPWRVLCEVYAKLLAMLIQHWLFLVSCWVYPDRSLFKAAQTIQKHALHLASSFECLKRLKVTINTIRRCLNAGCRINKRKKAPHTYQLLLDLSEGGLA